MLQLALQKLWQCQTGLYKAKLRSSTLISDIQGKLLLTV